MKSLLILAIAAFFAVAPQNTKPSPDSFTIDVDKVENGVRTIEATPARLVCSKKIVVKISTKRDIIQEVIYTGGCSGNLKAINSLTKGLTVGQAIEKLDGIDCAGRGTSCTDQLSRILKRAYGKE